MKKILLVLVILITATLFLGGCYICIDCICPPIQETVHPQVLETIPLCDLLEKYVRGWTPEAIPREMTLLFYDLVSKADIEWALDKIGAWGCCVDPIYLVKLFHELKGYELVPFGYVEYPNNLIVNVVVCKVGQEIKAFLVMDRELQELIRDPLIKKIVL